MPVSDSRVPEIAAWVGSFLTCESVFHAVACSPAWNSSGLNSGLATISICPKGEVDNKRLDALFSKCNSVLQVDVSACFGWSDIAVQTIATHCRKLISISLEYCELVSDAGIHVLAHQCTALVKISLCGLERVSDASVQSIAHSCSHLVDIDLDDTNLTDTGVQMLVASCHKLQYASVGGTYVTSVGAEALAERCSLTQASAVLHLEKRFNLRFRLFNIGLYRLNVPVSDLLSLDARYPEITTLWTMP